MPDRMGLCAFYWLKMVLYIKTAIVASIFMTGAASGYIAQAWRYDAQIAGIQAPHAVERPADPGAGEALLRAGCCGWDQARKGSI